MPVSLSLAKSPWVGRPRDLLMEETTAIVFAKWSYHQTAI